MKRNAMISAVFAAALVAGLAVEPAEAGIFDKIKDKLEKKIRDKAEEAEAKAKRKAEDSVERARDRAEGKVEEAVAEAEARIEGKVEGVLAGAEARVEGAVDGVVNGAAGAVDRAVGAVEGAVDGVVDGAAGAVDRAVGAVEGAVDGAVNGATGAARRSSSEASQAALRRPGDGGGLFVPPRGMSSRQEILAFRSDSRKRPREDRDLVSDYRRETRDAYYQFWESWYAKKEGFDTILEMLHSQRDQYRQIGAPQVVEAFDQRIAEVEAERRDFLTGPRWRHLGTGSGLNAPLILFGLELGSEICTADQVVEILRYRLPQLGLAALEPQPEEARERLRALVRDLTSIRGHAEAGDLHAAQRIMDRRWAWVMGD